MARGRSGVQYASVTTKRCPMYDDACAARVIAQISEKYAGVVRPWGLDPNWAFEILALLTEEPPYLGLGHLESACDVLNARLHARADAEEAHADAMLEQAEQ